MKKAIRNLDLKIQNKYEIGNCFSTSLKEIYAWYGSKISIGGMLGIVNNYNLVSTDPSGRILKCDFDMKRLDNNMLKMTDVCFDNVDDGVRYIKNQIDEGNPMIVFINTYYLEYTDDYLKRSGGMFGDGHTIIVHGYDEEDGVFIISDTTFMKSAYRLKYKLFESAWTYEDGCTAYRKLNALSFSLIDRNFDFSDLIRKSLYKDENSDADVKIKYDLGIIDRFYDLIINKTGEENFLSDEQFWEDVLYSVFHEVRWSRLVFSHFLCSDPFEDKYKETSLFFADAFEKWTKIHMYLFAAYKSKKTDRIKKAIVNMKEQIDEERMRILQF